MKGCGEGNNCKKEVGEKTEKVGKKKKSGISFCKLFFSFLSPSYRAMLTLIIGTWMRYQLDAITTSG